MGKEIDTNAAWTGRRVAVTGATGMLGAEVVRQLAGTGASIRLIVRDAGRLKPLTESLPEGVEIPESIECQLVNPIELKEALTGMDVVFHCAAQVLLRPNGAETLVRTNTDITHHMVNACIEAGVGRLVHVSSIAALGEANDRGVVDADSFPDNISGWSDYALSKFYSENEVWRGMRYGLKAVIVNPSIILGPGDWRGEGSARLFAALSGGIPFYVPGMTGFVDLRDVAAAMIRLSQSPEAIGKRFILNGANLSFREFITLAAQSRGKKPPRWKLGEKGINRLQRLSDAIAKITFTKPLLTDELVKAATAACRYDGEAVRRTIDFQYRPIDQTMRYLASAYLADRKRAGRKKRKQP